MHVKNLLLVGNHQKSKSDCPDKILRKESITEIVAGAWCVCAAYETYSEVVTGRGSRTGMGMS